MANQQPNVNTYSPNASPPESGQTVECGDDSGLITEFDETVSYHGQSLQFTNSSTRDEEDTSFLRPLLVSEEESRSGNKGPDDIVFKSMQPPISPKPHVQDTGSNVPMTGASADNSNSISELQSRITQPSNGRGEEIKSVEAGDNSELQNFVPGGIGSESILPIHHLPAPIPKDQSQKYWKAFLTQDIEDHFTTGKIFEVSKEIFPGNYLQYHDGMVSLYVRESFKPLFEAIINNREPLSSSSSHDALPRYVITGTLGVGISSFGFYLLRHLIGKIDPGKSILYQYTIGRCVKIMCTTGTASESAPWKVTCYDDTESTANLESDVSWYVCDDDKFGRFKLPTILIVSSPLPDICRQQASKCFYMPLWKWEEIEKMLLKVYVSRDKYRDAKKENHTIFWEKKDGILKVYKDAIQKANDKFQSTDCSQFTKVTAALKTPTVNFCNSMRTKDLDSELVTENDRLSTATCDASTKAAVAFREACNDLQKSCASHKQTFLDSMEAEAREFCKQTEELDDKHFPQLSDARWAFKHTGKLPSTYLYTTKSARTYKLDRLDEDIQACRKASPPRELQHMGERRDLPECVNRRVLHVSCDYDEENVKFKFTTPYLVVASPYVYEKLITPMSEGTAVWTIQYLSLAQLNPKEIGTQVYELAVHTLMKKRGQFRYQAHELGTYKKRQEPPKETTLDVKCVGHKIVKASVKKGNKLEIEIKPEEQNCYCQPADHCFPAIDSLIPSQRYLFQITKGNIKHPVNTKHLYDILTQLGWLNEVEKIKLIFIVVNKKFFAQDPVKKDSCDEDSKKYNKMFAKIKQYRLILPQYPLPQQHT